MVVAQRQFAVLAVKPVAAEIVPAGGAYAVPSPVAEGTDDLIEQGVVCIDSASLSHGHMMGRVEAGGSDISHRTGKFLLSVDGIPGSQGVAVILHQPEVMFFTELLHCLEIKGISQGMG